MELTNKPERIATLQAFLAPDEAILFTDQSHRAFYLGFTSSAGIILLTRERRYFIVDFRYIEAAAKIGNEFDIILQTNICTQIQEILSCANIACVFLDRETISLDDVNTVQKYCGKNVLLNTEKTLADFFYAQQGLPTKEEADFCIEGIAAGKRALKRLKLFVTPCATIPELCKKFTVLRSEEGDESRSFEAEFSCFGTSNLAVTFDVHKGGCRIRITAPLLNEEPMEIKCAIILNGRSWINREYY